MSHAVDPENAQPTTSIRQDVPGDGNQVAGQNSGTMISRAEQVTIYTTQNKLASIDEIKARSLIQRSPYLGLRKFEVRDKDLFFGRDQVIDHLRGRLKKGAFLLVLGASGSGKSSLIRAGLIPQLQKTLGSGFRDFILKPDRDPFVSLHSCLNNAELPQSQLEKLQTKQPGAILQIIQSLKTKDEGWLIFIDQFEELFTLCHDLSTRQAFIEGLMQLFQAHLPGVQLVIAMRADFLDRLGAYPQLTGILRLSELITDMAKDELEQVIEKPAARHGVVLEPGLTEEIIHDLKGRPGKASESERVSLPLLQYTLKLLWERSGELSDRTLRIHTYRALGGVRGALQRHVDEIYAPLPDEQKQAAKHIFLQLVDTISADAGTTAVGKAVSRRASLAEFSPTEQQVLYHLIDAGLLVSDDSTIEPGSFTGDRPPTNHTATVELAHETLIDAWDTLKVWIEESRPLIRLRNQLRDAAYGWFPIYQQNSSQAEAELWQGSKLQQLLAQRQEMISRFGDFKPEEAQFIQACEELSDRVRLREVRQLRGTVAGVSLSLVVASGLAILAGYQWIRAAQGEIYAKSQTAQARFTLNSNTFDSLLESLQAAEDYMRTPKLFGTTTLESTVMEALTQSVYWVKEKNRLNGHTGIIAEIAFSPDGQTIASASYDNTIKLWKRDGQVLPAQMSHAQPVISIAYSADGKLIASGSEDGSVKLWTNQGQLIKEIPKAHNKWVHSVSFDPKGRFFASASEDGDVKLWDLQGQPIRGIQAHQGAVRTVTFSPDGETLATAGADNLAKLWTLALQEKGRLSGHIAPVYAIKYSRDGKTVATSSKDGTVRLWSANGKAVKTFSANSYGWSSVAFSHDGRLIAASSRAEAGLVQIWDQAGNSVITLKGHDEQIIFVNFSPTELVLASGGIDQTVKLWDLSSPLVTVLNANTSSERSVLDVSFSPDGQLIASAVRNGQVEIWDWKARQFQQLTGHTEEVRGVSVSPDGDRVVSASRDGSIRLWSLVDNQEILPIVNAHTGGVISVQFSPQGDRFASGGEDAIVKIWDTKGQLLTSLVGHTGPVYRVSFSPDGQTIATSSQDNTVRLWDQNGNLKQILKGHQNAVWDVAFNPTHNLIATASGDRTIRLWSKNGNLIQTLHGHNGSVNAVVFDPNGERLFSASDDRTVKVWDSNGTILTTLAGHTSPISGLSLSNKGSILASGSSDGRVMVWQTQSLTLTQLHQLGCQWIKDFLNHSSNNSKKLCNAL